MPRIDHPNLGDVLSTQYRMATIVSVDTETDTATISTPQAGFSGVPIFYH